MTYQDPNYCLPIPYASLPYLHSKLGDIETVACVCHIWNRFHRDDSLRVKGDDGHCTIFITGRCSDVKQVLGICKNVTSICVGVEYESEPITQTITIEY
jgi:hypothetical protein